MLYLSTWRKIFKRDFRSNFQKIRICASVREILLRLNGFIENHINTMVNGMNHAIGAKAVMMRSACVEPVAHPRALDLFVVSRNLTIQATGPAVLTNKKIQIATLSTLASITDTAWHILVARKSSASAATVSKAAFINSKKWELNLTGPAALRPISMRENAPSLHLI